jgi:dUTP pyrophosphatase
MKIKIKRFDKTLPLPVHKTTGSAAVDLCSRIDVEIKAKEIFLIPMNVAIEIPEGYFIMLVGRSSTHKMGLMSINGIGVMDQDYCGDNDEYHFAAYNFTDQTVKIEKGTRLCQLVLIKYEKFEIEEVTKMENPSRGGFGTTGVK